MLSQLTLAAEERPWLWVVYILTVGLPIGLGVLFCWPKVRTEYINEAVMNASKQFPCHYRLLIFYCFYLNHIDS